MDPDDPGADWRPLGIPSSATAPLVATDAGTWTGDQTTYFYTYTYVNDWGWESAPSPGQPSRTYASDATAVLSGFAAPPSSNCQINRHPHLPHTGRAGGKR